MSIRKNKKVTFERDNILEKFLIEIPFFIALIIQMLQYQWSISMLSIKLSNNVYTVISAFFLVSSIVLRLLIGKKNDNYGLNGLIFSLIFICLTGIVYMKSDKTQVFILGLMIVAAYHIDFRKILRSVFLIKGIYFVITLIAWKLGIVENLLYIENRGIRQSIGFTSYNQGPRELFYLICCYLIIKKKKVSFVEIGLMELLAIYMAYETSSRTTLYSITMMLIIITVNKLMNNELFKKIFKIRLWKLMFVFGFIIPFIAVKLYNANPLKYELINRVFTGRLGLSAAALRNYPIKLFGQNIEWITIGARQIFTEYNYVDDSYLKMLLDYGILYSILIIILLTIVCNFIWRDKNYTLMIVLFFIAMRCMVQSELLTFQTNVFILLISQVIVYLDSTKKYKTFSNL